MEKRRRKISRALKSENRRDKV